MKSTCGTLYDVEKFIQAQAAHCRAHQFFDRDEIQSLGYLAYTEAEQKINPDKSINERKSFYRYAIRSILTNEIKKKITHSKKIIYVDDSEIAKSLGQEQELKTAPELHEVYKFIGNLPDRGQEIIKRRYLNSKVETLNEIGLTMNLSGERVRQICRQNLDVLRECLENG